MTEAEATKKPCIGPVPYNTGWPGNPDANEVVRFYCNGSLCLAWRVEHYENIAAALKATPHGFCGIAGRP